MFFDRPILTSIPPRLTVQWLEHIYSTNYAWVYVSFWVLEKLAFLSEAWICQNSRCFLLEQNPQLLISCPLIRPGKSFKYLHFEIPEFSLKAVSEARDVPLIVKYLTN